MKLLIIGAGGHGKVAADCATKMQRYSQISFIDEQHPQILDVGPWRIVGKMTDLHAFVDDNTEVFVAIGNNATRQRVCEELLRTERVALATLVHPDSIQSEHVSIGVGSLICAGTVLGVSSNIGKGCIINTAASIDHDNRIGNYVHVSVGARLAGTVNVGHQSFVCINATISNNINVGDNVTIGAGAVVIKNIPNDQTVVGIPAKPIKEVN